jgi:5-(carboxyamino)imidazole ribonucleotide synthase
MLALAGYPLGLEFRFFDSNQISPARGLGEFVNAPFSDRTALRAFATGVDLVTTEFENIDTEAVSVVSSAVPFYPGAKAVGTSQDRLLEKDFFNGLGIATAPYRQIDAQEDLDAAVHALGLPLVLKTRRLGYDGKGQVILRRAEDAATALAQLGGRDLIAEGFVTFKRELSVIAVRSVRGETAFYPLNVNTHINGILSRTVVSPELITPATQKAAEDLAAKALQALDYVGVLVIELFETDKGLIVNEMAPRVHNSGHWSIEGSHCGQFQNHLRAVCNLPLGRTTTFGHCGMLNILHVRPDMEKLLSLPGAKLHWYAKEPRPGRKLGHVTFVEDTLAKLETRLTEAASLLQF